jgi:hypothetical protein
MSVQCFLIKESNLVRFSLRRYFSDHTELPQCSATGWYHDAETRLGEFEKSASPVIDSFPHDDPGWPKTCACGFVFRPDDQWQLFENTLWLDSRTGKLVTLGESDPGAMYMADWDWMTKSGSIHWEKRGGGPHLIVKLPGGHYWDVDSKSRNGDGWTRSGEPPNVTANPSIGIYGAKEGEPWRYHGFLREGRLDPC